MTVVKLFLEFLSTPTGQQVLFLGAASLAVIFGAMAAMLLNTIGDREE
jgi:hypothetical protein